MQELNGAPVIPENFPGWTETMNSWGYKMIAATEVTHHLAWFSSLIMLFYACCLMFLCIQFFFFFFFQVVAEMAAIGFGLPKDAFTSIMKQVTYSTFQLVLLYSSLLVLFGFFLFHFFFFGIFNF